MYVSTRHYSCSRSEWVFPQPLIVSRCPRTGQYAAGNRRDPLQITRGLSQYSSLLLGPLSQVFYVPDSQHCFLISKHVSLQFRSCVKMLLRHTSISWEKRSGDSHTCPECRQPHLLLHWPRETVLWPGCCTLCVFQGLRRRLGSVWCFLGGGALVND